MNTYKRHRFPPDIICYAVWLYYRFNLSHRDIEDILAERGITVSRESIRLWCIKFGPLYARRLKRRLWGYGDTFYIDEVFAGVPDHSDQWQVAVSMASGRPGRRRGRCISAGEAGWCFSKAVLPPITAISCERAQEDRHR
jgi:transposase-like protein